MILGERPAQSTFLNFFFFGLFHYLLALGTGNSNMSSKQRITEQLAVKLVEASDETYTIPSDKELARLTKNMRGWTICDLKRWYRNCKVDGWPRNKRGPRSEGRFSTQSQTADFDAVQLISSEVFWPEGKCSLFECLVVHAEQQLRSRNSFSGDLTDHGKGIGISVDISEKNILYLLSHFHEAICDFLKSRGKHVRPSKFSRR